MNYKALWNRISDFLSRAWGTPSYCPVYKLIEISEADDGTYTAVVQYTNKRIIFHAAPEELLAEDKIVDKFSPRDIRTLTYLGYLGISRPKYTIMAKKLSEKNDKTVFAMRVKGKEKIIIKTVEEILQEQEILENLTPEDSRMIGYTAASENILAEKNQKEILKSNLQEKQNK